MGRRCLQMSRKVMMKNMMVIINGIKKQQPAAGSPDAAYSAPAPTRPARVGVDTENTAGLLAAKPKEMNAEQS